MSAYYDTSALVKLVVAEMESTELRAHWDTQREHASSALARTELMRAVRMQPAPVKEQARAVLASLDLITLDDPLLEVAVNLDPDILRTLDAIHIAAALTLGDSLIDFVTYDLRMAAAATQQGLKVVSPSPDMAN